MTLTAVSTSLAERLLDVLPERAVIRDAGERERFLVEERGLFQGEAEIVIAPASTEELSRAVALCHAAGVAMVPQGGNTGLVGGAVAAAGEVLVSLHRMNRIREVDPVNFTITLDAGCILADVQKAAEDAGTYFPLSLAAEGSCTIGGNIAANAGGVGVLRYGNTRELTLGLEVVLPDGRIWNGLRPLYKDNSGYSLKNLFIGSEGTLGFVTGATMKLFPRPVQKETAFCALPSVEAALGLLSLARQRSGDAVSAFELIGAFPLDLVCRHAGGTHPLESRAPWYALIELTSAKAGSDLRETFEDLLGEAFEAGLVGDAVLAETIDQAQRLWGLREQIPEAQKRAGPSVKHDISVPVSKIPEFVASATRAVEAHLPGVELCAFGHVGDGNVHYNFSPPAGMDRAAFMAEAHAINALVHPIAIAMNGSISAEHGIGLMKFDEVQHYRAPVETELMQAIRHAIDPRGLMNPGKAV